MVTSAFPWNAAKRRGGVKKGPREGTEVSPDAI